MANAATTYFPRISPEVPWEVRHHLQLIYQKLNNHTQAFENLVNANKEMNTTINNITEIGTGGGGGGGGGGTIPGLGGVNNQSGNTAYTTTVADNGVLLILNDASPVAVTLNSGISSPWMIFTTNLGAGLVTFTPTSGTINGGATFTLPTNFFSLIEFDGTNWWATGVPIIPQTFAPVAHEFLTSYSATTGLFTAAQPAFTDISGTATPSQLPLATSTTFGIVKPDNTTITIAAGVISSTGGGGPNFADNETPSGTINGTNVTFTLAHTPSPAGSLILTLAGLVQWQNASGDYTLSTNTITFTSAPTLGPLIAWYRF